MSAKEWIALAAAVISVLAIGVNALVSFYVNRRTLRTTRDLVQERAKFEVDKVLEERSFQRLMPRDDARVEVKSDLKELQRHSGENWFVLSTMLKRIEHPNGTPFLQHYAKLAYPSDLKSFQPEAEHLFEEPLLSYVQKIRVMIRNCNIEVDEAVDLARGRDADEVVKVTKDLLTKAGVMYTLWTAGMPGLLEATDWSHHGAIEKSRRDEIAASAKPDILATLKNVAEPYADKPLTMFNRYKPGNEPA